MKARIFTHGIYVYVLLPGEWLRKFKSRNAPSVVGQRLCRYWGVPKDEYRYVRIEPETDIDTTINNIENEIEDAKQYLASHSILPQRQLEVVLDGTKKEKESS